MQLAVRQRYIPESKVLAKAVDTDREVSNVSYICMCVYIYILQIAYAVYIPFTSCIYNSCKDYLHATNMTLRYVPWFADCICRLLYAIHTYHAQSSLTHTKHDVESESYIPPFAHIPNTTLNLSRIYRPLQIAEAIRYATDPKLYNEILKKGEVVAKPDSVKRSLAQQSESREETN
jgi:hypothetical protein